MSRSFVRPAVVVVSLLALLLPSLPGSAQRAEQQPTPSGELPALMRPAAASTSGSAGWSNCVSGSAGAGYSGGACISDPTPAQYTTVTVSGGCTGSVCYSIGFMRMTATWHFESGTRTCTATGWLGASCALNIGAATLGYRVNVDVDIGALHMTLWFTPWVDCSSTTEIPPSECRALKALYGGTNGAGWTSKSNWGATNTPCSWYGVTCGAQHVTGLDLASNQLRGSIPSELGSLTDLSALYLGDNQLTGSIPPELSDAYRLQTLYLFNNRLSGSIPRELGNLHYLRFLRLDGNGLSGRIPPELGNLGALEALDLQSNKLMGCLPQSLTNLHALGRFTFDTDLLWRPDNAAFSAWFAGIAAKSPGGTTCKTCYLPAVGR